MPQKKIQTKLSAAEQAAFDGLKTYVDAVKSETDRAFPGRKVGYTLGVSHEQMIVLIKLIKSPSEFT